MKQSPRPLLWLGDSLERLRHFPEAARKEIGFQLSLVQSGREPNDWRPMNDVGLGVIEIRVRAGGQFRAFYVAKFSDGVFVLHCFQKKTQKTGSLDLELGRKRYRALLARGVNEDKK